MGFSFITSILFLSHVTIQLPRERNKEYPWFYPFTLPILLFLTISRETPHPTPPHTKSTPPHHSPPSHPCIRETQILKTLNQILCCWPFDTQPDLKWTVCTYKRSPFHYQPSISSSWIDLMPHLGCIMQFYSRYWSIGLIDYYDITFV